MLKSGKYLPWPWTLNIKGKSYRFSTRIEAYQAIQRFLVLTELIDIGLVQANWRWQKQRFSDTWEALDPEVNLRVAATIFKEQYLISNDWWKAVGQYHAPNNAKNAEKYRKAVYKHCQNAGLIS